MDMAGFMTQTTRELEVIGERVNHIEHKLGDYARAHSKVIDAHKDLTEDISNMKLKRAEDRSCRNNAKFRGIPETFPSTELCPYLQKMIAELLPSVKPQELVIDRAHRLPKPLFLPERTPRDVIAKIHFFHVKDQLMAFFRQRNNLPKPYANILLFTNLS